MAAAPAGALEAHAGLDAGYAFRSQADGRNHGVAAGAFVDVPLPGPFAVRPELFMLGFPGSKTARGTLGLFAGALSLVYSFDDTDVKALASVGPLAGVSADSASPSSPALRLGVLAGLGLRFPVADVAAVDARVSLPAVMFGPSGVNAPGQAVYSDGTAVDFPLQTTFQIGVAFDLGALFSSLD